jgi:hypothetical protein
LDFIKETSPDSDQNWPKNQFRLTIKTTPLNNRRIQLNKIRIKILRFNQSDKDLKIILNKNKRVLK